MAIKGLTDRGAAFPRIGILRKGAIKPDEKRPGADLKDHFRFDTTDQAAAADFKAAYPDKPNHIRIMFYYQTTAENFETWQEHHSAGALKHRCDGETCVLLLGEDGTYKHDPVPCPSLELKRKNPSIDKRHLCRPVGRLKVIVPELRRMAYVLVTTTSINDILELQANLEAAEALRGDLRGIPFILSRRPRKVSTPSENGQRARREKWLLSLEPAPDWVRLQLTAMERAALPAADIKALPAPSGASYIDQDTGEIFVDDDEEEAPTEEQAQDLVTIAGETLDVKTWYTDNGEGRLAFNVAGTLIIAVNGLAETWFDMEGGEQVEVEGAWKEHPTKGRYLAAGAIRKVAQEAVVVADDSLFPE